MSWASRELDSDSSIGFKSDLGKPRMDLLPPMPLEMAAQVLTYGHEKYSNVHAAFANNWLQGMNWSRMYGAALRHLSAYWQGEDIDKESGLSHLGHALACILILAEYSDKKELYEKFDDRPTPQHVIEWRQVLEAPELDE